MIVVIGSPSVRPGDPGQPSAAAGRPIDVARGAADAGSIVQLVGKIGDDPAGDALLLALAAAGIGHAAILRDPARSTPVAPPPDPEFEAFLPDDLDLAAADGPDAAAPDARPMIDGGDLDLALRYLPDHRVVVIAEAVERDALEVVVADCSYVGAALVLILDPGGQAAALPAGATVFESPESDPDGLFGRTVGRYAAARDQGIGEVEALAQATTGAGWQPAAG